jgi:methanogenic corrinoid protein MtbC1
MANQDRSQGLIKLIEDLQEKRVLDQVRTLIDEGIDPITIIKNCQKGMLLVGERYHQGQYFIGGLIMAGEILQQVVEVLKPKMTNEVKTDTNEIILVGTVQGDIHDLGKNIFTMLLSCNGFNVVDLGVDVSAEIFLSKAIEHQPRIVGISSLLTEAIKDLRHTVQRLQSEEKIDQKKMKIVIGGSNLDDEVCQFIGADHWTNDATTGVSICQDIFAT